MTQQWTIDQVLALAPDAGVLKSGKEQAIPRKWQSLGQNEQAAWGECKGSAASPYKTRIDLVDLAFGCTCPSHKFPCKHALGLFLMLVTNPADFTKTPPPQWVVDWLTARAQRAQKRAVKAQTAGQVADPAAQAKRAAQRQSKVAGGVEELDLLIRDVIRVGLAEAYTRPYTYWENVAARMVDAQATGLAREVRLLAATFASGEGWPARVLERLGKLHLLIQGYRRLESLPAEVQADIATQIGFTWKQEELLARPGVRDQWLVLGRSVEEVSDQERTARTWLLGQNSGRSAVVMQFMYGNQTLDTSLIPDSILDAELVFYPSAFPLRALVKTRFSAPKHIEQLPGHASILAATQVYSAALVCVPWLDRFPMLIRDVIPIRHSQEWVICDGLADDRRSLPVSARFISGWELVAVSGGHPVTIFGEWDGDWFLPVGIWIGGRYVGV